MATTVYRDYGTLNGASAPNNQFELKRYTQVYQVTHEGEQRLPFMNRSFISFSFGERPDKNGIVNPVYIEDFDLIATFSNDGMDADAYGSFEDLTSTYDTIHGQFYWGTYFHQRVLNFTLSSDHMTQRQLDDFKLWFRAGQIKELILAEHPNRAALARVSQPPKIKMIPFEEKITVPIGSGGTDEEPVTVVNYSTSTTVYRGDIELELTLDEPFWYAKQNILGTQNKLEGFYDENWIDANGRAVPVKGTPDALKIIYEDRIPLGSTTRISVFLGGDTYATVLYETYSLIVEAIEQTEYENTLADDGLTDITKASYFNNGDTISSGGEYYFPSSEDPFYEKYYRGAVIATVTATPNGEEEYQSGGKVGGANLNEISDMATGISLHINDEANLYYAGTAPSPVKLSFTLTPQFTNNMISTPRNKYTTEEKPYNTITLTAVNDHNFDFTIPTLYASYNQVMTIFNDESVMAVGNAWLLVRETIRDTIRHPIVRAWANKMIDKYDNEYGSGIISNLKAKISANDTEVTLSFTDDILPDITEGMSCLFKKMVTNDSSKTFDGHYSASFTFDGKTGSAIGNFTTLDPATITIDPITQNEGGFVNTSLREQILSSDNLAEKTFVENVGDMVKSSYLILDERNVLDDNFQVQAWSLDHPDYSYLIKHDVQDRLNELHFEFKNMYL